MCIACCKREPIFCHTSILFSRIAVFNSEQLNLAMKQNPHKLYCVTVTVFLNLFVGGANYFREVQGEEASSCPVSAGGY